jgi:hypothetical protein
MFVARVDRDSTESMAVDSPRFCCGPENGDELATDEGVHGVSEIG